MYKKKRRYNSHTHAANRYLKFFLKARCVFFFLFAIFVFFFSPLSSVKIKEYNTKGGEGVCCVNR